MHDFWNVMNKVNVTSVHFNTIQLNNDKVKLGCMGTVNCVCRSSGWAFQTKSLIQNNLETH